MAREPRSGARAEWTLAPYGGSTALFVVCSARPKIHGHALSTSAVMLPLT